MIRRPEAAIFDTCFWLGLWDASDQWNTHALGMADYLELVQVLCPWPVLYETINTRFVKNRHALERFEKLLAGNAVTKINDAPYRETALLSTFVFARSQKRDISLVDMIIRHILEDVNVKCKYLITFDPTAFGDVCRKRGIEMLSTP